MHRPPPLATTPSGGNLLENERLVQEWTVTSDPGEHVESILVAIGCQAYVTYAPAPAHDVIATVRVTGDNADIIQRAVKVSTADSELRVTLPALKAGKVQGHVRTEILVHTDAVVQEIPAAGSGDVVVDDHVLGIVRANTFTLQSNSSGAVHLLGEEFNLTTLDVRGDGSRNQYLGFRTLETTNNMRVVTTGSGSTNLFTSHLRAPQLVVQVSGSGRHETPKEYKHG